MDWTTGHAGLRAAVHVLLRWKDFSWGLCHTSMKLRNSFFCILGRQKHIMLKLASGRRQGCERIQGRDFGLPDFFRLFQTCFVFSNFKIQCDETCQDMSCSEVPILHWAPLRRPKGRVMARMGQSPAPKAWDGVLRHQHQQYPGSGELKAESSESEYCKIL